MKTVTLFEHRNLLLVRQEKLKVLLENIKTEIAEASKAQTNFLVDPIDHVVEQSELSSLLDINEKYMKEYQQVSRALEQIKKGTFGKCSECGDEIAYRRLLVHPSATCCVECQDQKEELIGMETIFTINKFKGAA